MCRTLLVGTFCFFVFCRICHFIFQRFQLFVPILFFFEVLVLLINFSVLCFNCLNTNLFLMAVIRFLGENADYTNSNRSNDKNGEYKYCFFLFVICFHFEMSSLFSLQIYSYFHYNAALLFSLSSFMQTPPENLLFRSSEEF